MSLRSVIVAEFTNTSVCQPQSKGLN